MAPERAGDPLSLKWDINNGKYTYTMQVKYLFATEEIEFTVDAMNNSWIALGFGSDMTDTDMIAWHANGDDSYS